MSCTQAQTNTGVNLNRRSLHLFIVSNVSDLWWLLHSTASSEVMKRFLSISSHSHFHLSLSITKHRINYKRWRQSFLTCGIDTETQMVLLTCMLCESIDFTWNFSRHWIKLPLMMVKMRLQKSSSFRVSIINAHELSFPRGPINSESEAIIFCTLVSPWGSSVREWSGTRVILFSIHMCTFAITVNRSSSGSHHSSRKWTRVSKEKREESWHRVLGRLKSSTNDRSSD